MKRPFDTIVIFDAGLDEATLGQKIQKIESIIKASEGEISKLEKWGKRRLAYEVKKKIEGNYVYFFHNSESAVVEQLQTLFRFDEAILKSLTIQVDQVKRSRFGRKKKKKKVRPMSPVITKPLVVETAEGESNG